TTNVNICTNQLPYTWKGEAFNMAGTYEEALTSSEGCDPIATLVLSENPVLASTTNADICENELPYTWNGTSYNAAGTYSVKLTGTNGCDSVATLILSVNAVSTSTTNVSICDNAFPYSWNGQAFNAAGTYNVTLTGAN